MDSYEVSHESNISNERNKSDTFGKKFQDVFRQNVLFTLIGHEYRLGIQARIQKIWLYFSLFYGVLMLISGGSIQSLQSFLVFFINFGTILAFIPASSSISGEIGGIADTILSKTVRRWQYVLSKHIAHMLITLTTFISLNAGILIILGLMRVFTEDMHFWNLILLIGIDALILCTFTTLAVFLSSLFTKPIFPILGGFIAWFILIFLFILIPVWQWEFSPVVINGQFDAIIADTWDVKYWLICVAFSCSPIVFILSSMVAFHRLDF